MAKEQAPVPLRGVPTPPAHLPAVARKKFRDVARQLDEAGVLSLLDRDILTQYCSAWYHWRQAQDHMALEGAVIKNNNGCVQMSPWWNVSIQSVEKMKAFMGMLGLSPAARAKLGVGDAAEVGEEWKGF